jgi:hypothetical protein
MKEMLDLAPDQPPDRPSQKEISAFQIMEEGMMDGMTFVSQASSTVSRMSTGPALLHKLKSQQSKIKAKATSICNVIGHSDIISNPTAVARAGMVWSQIEQVRSTNRCVNACMDIKSSKKQIFRVSKVSEVSKVSKVTKVTNVSNVSKMSKMSKVTKVFIDSRVSKVSKVTKMSKSLKFPKCPN